MGIDWHGVDRSTDRSMLRLRRSSRDAQEESLSLKIRERPVCLHSLAILCRSVATGSFSSAIACYFRAGLWYTRRRPLLALWGAAMAVGKSFRVSSSLVREGWGMGLALMVLIWLITLVSTYFFVAKTWWLPAGAAAAAGLIDGQFALTFVHHGDCVSRGAAGAGLHRVEIPRAAVFSARVVFPRKYQAGSRLDGADGGAVHRLEPDGQQRVGEPALDPAEAARCRWRSPGCSLPGTSAIRGRTGNTARPASS